MLRQFTFFSFLILLASVANAENDIRYYNIEILLFEHTNPANAHAESWIPPKLSSNLEQVELTHQLGTRYIAEKKSPYNKKLMFTRIPKKEYQLKEEAKKIGKSNSRRLLMHTAWRQAGLARDNAIRVQFKQSLEHLDSNIQKSIPHSNIAPISSGSPVATPYLEGSVKVILARYLHVETDILYYAKAPKSQPPTSNLTNNDEPVLNEIDIDENKPLQLYQITQLRRRIRSKELHYLDHPIVGMLLIITPNEDIASNKN